MKKAKPTEQGPWFKEALPTKLRADRMERRLSWKQYWRLLRQHSTFPIGEMTIYRTAMGHTAPQPISVARIEDALKSLERSTKAPRLSHAAAVHTNPS